jgi:hypothetical protein
VFAFDARIATCEKALLVSIINEFIELQRILEILAKTKQELE